MARTGNAQGHGWRYYDSVAATYERIWAPVSTLPASDLVVMLALPRGGLAVDVGTGTGAAAVPALKAVGPEGVVVGIDPALEMLRLAQGNGMSPLVAAEVPGLPFPNGTIDAVLANFALSHFAHYEVALFDAVRILRPGGRLGVTAWGASRSDFGQAWQDTAESFMSADLLRDAVRQAVPWEEWFSEPTHVRQALEDAGLVSIDIQRREYRITMSAADYLFSSESSLKGRFMRQRLDAAVWERFRERVAKVFRSRFQDTLEFINDVHLAVGTKPHA
jgi:ubiquinone/menaquinone biosynthesis C-methylase UbiE